MKNIKYLPPAPLSAWQHSHRRSSSLRGQEGGGGLVQNINMLFASEKQKTVLHTYVHSTVFQVDV